MAEAKKNTKKVVAEKVVAEKPEPKVSGADEAAKQALIGRGIANPSAQQISDYKTRMGLE
tara:strand:- start:146 stop:325 length:180 start_codon:yes stop_codon:yes gene_type:complete